MTWEKQRDRFGRETGDIIAKGKRGHFLLWKDGHGWRILYMDTTKEKVVYRSGAETLREAKRQCEENFYWEEEDGNESDRKGSA